MEAFQRIFRFSKTPVALFLFVSAAVTFFTPPPAIAQSSTTAGLIGRVVDESGGAMPGVTVQIESGAMIGGLRAVTTDKEGRYRFSQLPPGVYTVTFVMPGFKTFVRTDIKLNLGATTDLPIKLTQYIGEETVTVTGLADEIDVTSAAMPTTLPSEYLNKLPTSRDQTATLNLAPGINLDSAFGGGESSANAYQIDGVDTSDPDGGTPWSFFNYNIIQEVSLVGLGAPAEYGEFTGVVFNSITKSGSNELSGLVEGLFTNGSLTGTSKVPGFATSIGTTWETTLQTGGPIKKDKLWYFVDAQYFDGKQNDGGPDRTEKDPRVFAKLTWQATPNNTIESFLEWDRYDITGRGGDAFTPIEATRTEKAPEYVWNVNWKSAVSADTTLTAALTGYTGYYYLYPASGNNIAGRIDQDGNASDNSTYFYYADRTRNQLVASISHHASHFAGSHDFKFGMEIERSTVHSRYGYPTGSYFYDYKDPKYAYTLAYSGGGYDVRAKNERLSYYVQDSWQIAPRLTLNPGIRVDMNRGYVPRSGLVFNNNPVAPRFGLVWDVTGDGKNAIKAHYGRFYEALFGAYYYNVTPDAFPDLNQHCITGPCFVSDKIVSYNYDIDPHLKQPYLQQYTGAYERELIPGLALSVQGIYRTNRDFIETTGDPRDFTKVRGNNPANGESIFFYEPKRPDVKNLTYTNPPGLKRRYAAGVVTLTKRFSRNWLMVASYVRAKARGNFDNQSYSSTSGGNAPSGYLDTPNSRINAWGRLTHDQKDQVKLQGSYEIPKAGLLFSGNFTYYSGDTWTPRERFRFDNGSSVRYYSDTRGSQRLHPQQNLDLRAAWSHPIAKGGNLNLFVDCFNVTNQGRVDSVLTFGSTAGEPATATLPRNFRIGANFSF